MSAPTKPAKAQRKRAAVRAVPVAPIVLTQDEAELLRCYRTMDQRHKDENLTLMAYDAERYPIVRRAAARPALGGIRLVADAGRLVRA